LAAWLHDHGILSDSWSHEGKVHMLTNGMLSTTAPIVQELNVLF
jgi:hypothetical protein